MQFVGVYALTHMHDIVVHVPGVGSQGKGPKSRSLTLISMYVHNVDRIRSLSVDLINRVRSGRYLSGASSVQVGLDWFPHSCGHYKSEVFSNSCAVTQSYRLTLPAVAHTHFNAQIASGNAHDYAARYHTEKWKCFQTGTGNIMQLFIM